MNPTYAQLSNLSESESVQSYPGREDRGERAGERASLPGQEVGGGLLLCHRRKRVRVRVQAASQLRFTPNCANIFILSLSLSPGPLLSSRSFFDDSTLTKDGGGCAGSLTIGLQASCLLQSGGPTKRRRSRRNRELQWRAKNERTKGDYAISYCQ